MKKSNYQIRNIVLYYVYGDRLLSLGSWFKIILDFSEMSLLFLCGSVPWVFMGIILITCNPSTLRWKVNESMHGEHLTWCVDSTYYASDTFAQLKCRYAERNEFQKYIIMGRNTKLHSMILLHTLEMWNFGPNFF